ncbi:hypothetical protein Vretimale_12499, partial [Volvox reticuliferus]
CIWHGHVTTFASQSVMISSGSVWKINISNALLPETRSSAAVSEKGSASTYDAELQRLLLAGPPTDFDFRTEVTTSSCQWVDDIAPQLRDLVDDGTVVVVPRRPDYQERRTDGYCEPRVVVLVGTAHVSRRSQQDVDRVIRAVVPDSVVVELCKSRSAALMATGDLSPSGTSPGWAAAGTTTTPAGSISGSDSDSDLGFGDAAWLKDGAAASSLCNSRSSSSPSLPAYVNPMNLAGGGDDGGGRGGGALPGVGFLGAVARSVSLGGQSALLLRVLLAGLASRTAGESLQIRDRRPGTRCCCRALSSTGACSPCITISVQGASASAAAAAAAGYASGGVHTRPYFSRLGFAVAFCYIEAQT